MGRQILINCSVDSSIYQSNGLCSTFCRSSYAFAVVQDDGCWCSNYAPGTTTTGCDTQCPGYPPELCGGNGLYGYIALDKAPSGTEGGSSAASSTATSSATTQQVSPLCLSPAWCILKIVGRGFLVHTHFCCASIALLSNHFDSQ